MKLPFIIAAKDLLVLVRDPQAVFFTMVFPLAFALLFGALFDTAPSQRAGVRIAAHAHEYDTQANTLLERLAAEDLIQLERAASPQAASDAVRANHADIALILDAPADQSAANTTIAPPALRSELRTGPSQHAHAALVEGLLFKHATAIKLERFLDAIDLPPGIRTAATQPPIQIERETTSAETHAPSNIYSISFAQSMAWALMACAAAFAVSIVEERESGSLLRLRTSHAGLWSVLLGKAAACFFMATAVCFAFVLIATVGFGVRPIRPAMLAAAIMASAVCFAGIMTLLATIARGRSSPGQLAWGVLLIAAVAGGAMLPLAFMPAWMQPVSTLSPVRWAILATEAALWRDLTWIQTAPVLLGLVAAGSLSFAAGGAAFAAERHPVA